MENLKPINYLPNPHINAKKLDYIHQTKKVYANLFEIKLTKDIKMYQYPFEVNPEIAKESISIRQKIFKEPYREIKAKYGFFLIDGDSLYSLVKIDEINIYKTSLKVKKEKIEYKIKINKCKNEIPIKEEEIRKSPLQKHFIELIIKDILLANPDVERFKDTYILKNKGESFPISENTSINFYPGYRTAFVETDGGMFLNVVLTHKFIRDQNLLNYIKLFGDIKNKEIQSDINAELKGHSFKVGYAKRNYQIGEISFDRNPENQTFNYEGKTMNLIQYYKIRYSIDIKNKNQPLILVHKKDAQDNPLTLYFVPELCYIVGLDEYDVSNTEFMSFVSQKTQKDPTSKVNEINKFVDLLEDQTEHKQTHMNSKKKTEHYGIQLNQMKDSFSAYYMKPPELQYGNRNHKPEKIELIKNMFNGNQKPIRWVLFYEKNEDENEDYIIDDFNKAKGRYNIKLENPKKVLIPKGAKVNVWIETANKYFKEGKKDYDFALFLLWDKSESSYYYPELKKHSLCTNGYVSQVVKVSTLYNKSIMSICSKILLQLNAKLGGALYKLQTEKALAGKKIMVIGVDSSRHRDKNNYGTGIAMVATINNSFTDFYNETKIIKVDDMKTQFHFCISKFIEEATKVYEKKNGAKPEWIIIYRQGVSLQQKEKLKSEIREIDNTCLTNNIKYYYILVNTKSTFKFFEK